MYYFKDGKLIEIEETIEKLIDSLKNKLIIYLLKNANIAWLNDDTEQQLYELLFDFLEPLIFGQVLKGYRALPTIIEEEVDEEVDEGEVDEG